MEIALFVMFCLFVFFFFIIVLVETVWLNEKRPIHSQNDWKNMEPKKNNNFRHR